MIEGRDIERLVELLDERDVRLHHACQLMDFESYLEVGGVPSRALLERRGLPFTTFQTDERDRDNSVWDKVFFNLEDFGGIFARSCAEGKANSVPNPFGAVLLVLRPEALLGATDVGISLLSAGAMGFDRGRESLNLNDVPRLFLGETSKLIKYSDKLAVEFNVEKSRISAPEVSCTVPDGRIAWDHVMYIRVDPYEFHAMALADHVEELVERADLDLNVYERDGDRLYRDLGEALRAGYRDLETLVHDTACSDGLRKWAGGLAACEPRVTRQWPRYARYLVEGTIGWLERKEKESRERSRGVPRVVDLDEIW